MPKKVSMAIIIISIAIICKNSISAADNLSEKLAGRIVLQVEQKGEAWYINPIDQKKYYLGRPDDAFALMRQVSKGITNSDIEKIPIGILESGADSDNDGLSDALEDALGTDPNKTDTDGDGYSDKEEIENNFNPLGAGAFAIDNDFAAKNLGLIFLQVEEDGEAWYLDPISRKRYFLSRPADAFLIMRRFGLGISDENINKIQIAYLNIVNDNTKTTDSPICTECCKDCNQSDEDDVISGAASAIRANNKAKAVSYFIPEMKNAIEYTLDFLDAEGRLALGNILSGSKLTSETATKKTYSNEVYFSLGGYKVPLKFYVEKQENGEWLLINL